jgi:hypothetical protein
MTMPSRLLIASCDTVTRVQLDGAEVTVRVHDGVSAGLEIVHGIGTTSRLYVALEAIRGTFDATVLQVHFAETYLGSVALYGLRTASSPRSDGTGAGLTGYVDITSQAHRIIGRALAPDAQLKLSIRPHQTLPQGIEITIERICLYAESIAPPGSR